MTKQNRDQERDAVLYAFHEAFARPTAAQIIEWAKRYPEFADDIRAHAAIAREWDDNAHATAAEPSESLLAAAYSRTLNLMYKASAANKDAQRTFQEIIAARNMTLPQVARAVGIDRAVVADLVSGRMSGPIRPVFSRAVAHVLAITNDVFDALHRRALLQPTLGLAKAAHAPSIVVRPYDDIIRTCDELTPHEKKKWLEDA
ncbi:MAG: helix-turn-helix transcriptional regulator [Pseudomonadota bacterium]